jgi:hypothetical protein
LEQEVEIQNSPEYRTCLAELLELERVLKHCQALSGDSRSLLLSSFGSRRMQLRSRLREMFNSNFGSPFRTHTSQTLYAFNLQRLSDIYTAKLENFCGYPLDRCTFYPTRSFLPHEVKIPFFFFLFFNFFFLKKKKKFYERFGRNICSLKKKIINSKKILIFKKKKKY